MEYSALEILDWYDGLLEGFIRVHPTGEMLHFFHEELDWDTDDDRLYVFRRLNMSFTEFKAGFPEGNSLSPFFYSPPDGKPLLDYLDFVMDKVEQGILPIGKQSLRACEGYVRPTFMSVEAWKLFLQENPDYLKRLEESHRGRRTRFHRRGRDVT